MADGWLFRLSATLGARQSVPSWPSAVTVTTGNDAAPAPVLRSGTPDRPEPAATIADDKPPA